MQHTKYHCHTCGGYISWEHGGIVCAKCDALYCCNKACVPIKIPGMDYDQSTRILYCNCEKAMALGVGVGKDL